MPVDAATVRRIAHLARIAVAEEEVEHLQTELNVILAFVEQLSEVNVSSVEPRAAGCDAYISKPYSPRQLLAKVREYLPSPAPTR